MRNEAKRALPEHVRQLLGRRTLRCLLSNLELQEDLIASLERRAEDDRRFTEILVDVQASRRKLEAELLALLKPEPPEPVYAVEAQKRLAERVRRLMGDDDPSWPGVSAETNAPRRGGDRPREQDR